MNTPTLKEKIITKIQSIDNEDLLKEVYQLLEMGWIDTETYTLSDDQINVVHEAQEQIKKGSFLTHEEAQQKINQWLNK